MPRLPLPRLIPRAGMQIEKLDRGNAHTGSERLPYFRSLPLRATARLSPGLPIKALDPVGTSFLLFITANRQEVTEIFRNRPNFLQQGLIILSIPPV